MSGSIVYPTAGERVVLATVCYSSMISHFPFPVTCYSLSGLALVSVVSGLFKAVIPGMHGIHLPDKSFLTIGFPSNIIKWYTQ